MSSETFFCSPPIEASYGGVSDISRGKIDAKEYLPTVVPYNFKRLAPARDATTFLAIAVCLIVLLAACGGGNISNTNPPSTPTTVASTPDTPSPTNTSSATPTPVPGFTQVVLIITESNGSFSFNPTTLTIRVGTTVIWKNMSSAPHTVTSDDGQTFDSGTVAPGGTFKFKFTTVGTFSYHCNYHPYMKATISLV
jgi:plastocyanin